MKRARLSDSLAIRITARERTSIESVAEQKELAMAELARAYIKEGLARDGIVC